MIFALCVAVGSAASAHDHAHCGLQAEAATAETVETVESTTGHEGHAHMGGGTAYPDAAGHADMGCVQHACAVFAFVDPDRGFDRYDVHTRVSRPKNRLFHSLTRPESPYRPPSA